jgi:hypothetical protein
MAQDLWWAFGAVAAGCLWLAVASVLAARRPLDPPAVDAWAAGHGLTDLPAGGRELAERYLRRGRLFRTVGGAVPFLAGTVAPALWAATRGLPAPWPLSLLGVRSWLAGYLVGVLVAEWSWARPHGGPLRSAALAPRELGGYLPGRVVAGLRLAAVAVVALVPLVAWLPAAPARELALRGRGGALATAAVAVGAALAVELLLRRMVGRPQPVADPDARAVDDALRSTSAHAAAGAGLAIVLLSLSLQLGNLAVDLGVAPARTALVGLSLGCAVAALVAWARIGHPRPRPPRAAAAAAAGRPARP